MRNNKYSGMGSGIGYGTTPGLNPVPHLRLHSTNPMKKSKGRKGSKGSARVSGRPGAGRTFAYPSKGIDARVVQVNPAQYAVNDGSPLSKVVSSTPPKRKQHKTAVASKNEFMKSIRKSMGY